ncbi:MAG: twin-arginine translocation signal domain-containing protein [Verrucomicrobia bacterium]|nr:twin-arginine translocation signal domain-containing protein [Verrucomicrobiota bacterium]
MATNINRRKFLKGSLVAGGAAAALASFEEKALGAEMKGGRPAAAKPPPDPMKLPMGKIGALEVSRMICGGNLIGGWAHSRDLIYVSPLLKAYHTDEKIFETLRLAERRGVNTVLTNPAADRVLNDYWNLEGGKIQWISDCASGDMKDSIRRSVDNGAHAIYLQGGICDKLVREGNLALIEEGLKFMRQQKVPCGLGAHSLDTVKACVKAGFDPDFWVKTLHQDNYWSATPVKSRRPFDEISGRSGDHDQHHDNMWCTNAKETIEFMGRLNKPWIAFKVLAAGAIHPRLAFQWAFESGADFICIGMFDFQVVENTDLAARALAAVTPKNRARPWMA